MEFVLIRHSLTPGNLEKQYVGSTDQPLARRGRSWPGSAGSVCRRWTAFGCLL